MPLSQFETAPLVCQAHSRHEPALPASKALAILGLVLTPVAIEAVRSFGILGQLILPPAGNT